MLEIKKNVIKFDSSDGVNTIVGYAYSSVEIAPKAVVQISHGMCEYIGRYDDFAEYMVQNGYAVFGNDHLGHGATSSGEHGTDGYFAERDGRKYVLKDLRRMNQIAHEAYPELPVILLGHSMGSFFARKYAVLYPDTIQGLILSGTGGPNPAAGIGLMLTDWLIRRKGGKYRSKLVNDIAFGQYLKRVKDAKTPYDWISRDTEIVEKYAKDPKCTFIFTVSAFHDLLSVLRDVNKPEWAQSMRKDLPTALVAGRMDPVGNYGKGVEEVHQMLKDAGVSDLTLTLYPGARHEILNETNRDEVYKDILAWCDAHVL